MECYERHIRSWSVRLLRVVFVVIQECRIRPASTKNRPSRIERQYRFLSCVIQLTHIVLVRTLAVEKMNEFMIYWSHTRSYQSIIVVGRGRDQFSNLQNGLQRSLVRGLGALAYMVAQRPHLFDHIMR
jgi:hypothetical protein